jgi:hypothetical protein
MEGPTAVLIGAGLATCGWLYSARRARTLSRKQHTVNVMLQASFNEDFRASIDLIAEAMKRGKCPDLQTGDNDALNKALMLVTNHMEFIAAGLRNGDFDESLVKDSWRGQTLVLFEFYEETSGNCVMRAGVLRCMNISNGYTGDGKRHHPPVTPSGLRSV